MRLPHHLVRSSTGVFHFRQKVPLALQPLLGLRVIKRSLGTRDARAAQVRAYLLSARYAQAFEQAGRRARMAGNPAVGQITYGTREKRLRRKLGFQAFTVEQLDALYDPEHLATLSESVRWGALIGLYTGARVSEVGQLALADFVEVDGVSCFRITAQGVGQSLKTDASERTIPIHADLIMLGILERVKALKAAGESRFFPRAKVGSVNGAGNFLSAAFGRYIDTLRIKAEVGKGGFHSLRKTVVQVMQGDDVPAEYRAQYVGHELDDEHHAAYSREYTPRELAKAIHPALTYGLDLTAISRLLE